MRVLAGPDIAEELDRLRKRVSAQATMADLGPKLLAALVELGAAPRGARTAAGKAPTDGRTSKLHQLRAEVVG